MENQILDQAQWLKSPLTEKADRLRPVRELSVQSYQGSRKTIRLFRTHYLVGSGEGCDIRLQDPFVCARHAEIKFENDGYVVTDLSSRNGVFLNGVRVRSAPLFRQGNLRFGRSTLTWRVPEEDFEEAEGLVVADPAMRELIEKLKRAARAGLSVMLLGETGTGKEILARIIHRASARARQNYVVVNGALTGGSLVESELFGHKRGAFTGAEKSRRGALRSADRGTLFIDEVADIPMSTQVMLLRALESGEVRPLGADETEKTDLRLISATSQDIDRRISESRFRLDLYYRLAGLVVHVPPLRERPSDILAIARNFLAGINLELDRESEAKLLSYDWPGNVRELRSCLARAALVAGGEECPRILPSHILDLSRGSPRLVHRKQTTLKEMERDYIRASLERNGWTRGASARELGIARSTLLSKMRRYSLRSEVRAD